jgi:hypothetical protein
VAGRVTTVAFEGVEARRVEVEVQLTSGTIAFAVVGLPDKAVAESKERVRAAFTGLGLALPGKRIVANLSPADLPKEGNHYDLPIALAGVASAGAERREGDHPVCAERSGGRPGTPGGPVAKPLHPCAREGRSPLA